VGRNDISGKGGKAPRKNSPRGGLHFIRWTAISIWIEYREKVWTKEEKSKELGKRQVADLGRKGHSGTGGSGCSKGVT